MASRLRPFVRLTIAAGLALTASVAADAQSSPSPYLSATRYDAAGRVVGTIAPDPDGAGTLKHLATRNTYNDAGFLTKVETGELSAWKPESVLPSTWGSAFEVHTIVETTYDARGRKTKEVVKGSDLVPVSLTQYSYDSFGRLECTAVRMNPAQYGSLPASACTLDTEGSFGPDRITKTVYDAAGQVLKVQKAYGTPLQQDYVTYTYTPNGKQNYVVDANGNKAQYAWDGHDRLYRWYFPHKTSTGSVDTSDYEQYGYDANGNRTSLRKRDGSTLTFQYDALNRMTRKTVPDRSDLAATHERDVFYGYDLAGLQTYARFDSTSGQGITHVWDGFGRQTSATVNLDGQSRQLSYLYDKDGNRTRITHPDAAYFTYTYDGLDRLDQIRTSVGSVLVDYAFNNRGSLATDARYSTMPDRAFSYDPAGRLGGLSIGAAPASYAVEWSFTRNYAGQILTEGRDNDDYAWPGQPDITYAYDANGLNQYTTDGLHDYCYDANGNLTADDGYVYKYDIENRLVEMRVQTSSTCPTDTSGYTGTLKASLRYDPLGRLHEAIDNATGATTRFLYDGDALVGEYNTSGTLLRRYMHGNDAGADDPLVWWEGAALRAVYADARGSVVLVRDSAGATVAVNSYDEWGVPETSGNDIATRGRFRYTGQAWLPEIGMYYYKARLYSPKLGRFLQTDPIGYDDQINLYAYVGNDPINAVDPGGERILIVGTKQEVTELKAALLTAAKAAPELTEKYNELIISDNVHTLSFDKFQAGSSSRSVNPENAENGQGTGTDVGINKVQATGRLSDGTKETMPSVIAHEMLGHSYEADKGTMDRSFDAESGIRKSEISATKTENIYREAAGLPERTHYSGKEIPFPEDEL